MSKIMIDEATVKLVLKALESCDAAHITDGGHQWYDEKLVDKAIATLKALAEQPAQQEPVALGPLAKRRVFDYIRGAYDLGYNDARNEKAIPGDSAPGYKGRDVEADHGSALFHALEAINALRKALAEQPAQQEYTSFAEWANDYVRANLHKLKEKNT